MKPRVTFLLVEDNELDVEKLRRGMKRLGLTYTLCCAGDGYEALELLRGENGQVPVAAPYVILLDLNMPRMNGLEFLAELRADPCHHNAVVFVLTTSDNRKDIDAAYGYNVAGYLLKPLSAECMQDALSMLHDYSTSCELPVPVPEPTTTG